MPAPDAPPPPIVGVTACLKEREDTRFHSVMRQYVDAVTAGVGALPVILPAVGERPGLDALLDRLDGVLLTGSPSNVGADRYDGPAPRAGDLADADRDATTLPLIRRAIERGVPLLGICRGIQELNVALGGTLHQHLQEVPGRFDHRSDKSRPRAERYLPRHPVRLEPEGALRRIMGEAAPDGTIRVNSLHGQGLDRLAGRLRVEALAEDGTVEATSVEGAPAFALGVQWHPEYAPLEDPWSRRLFGAFGDAVRAHAAAAGKRAAGPRQGQDDRLPRVA